MNTLHPYQSNGIDNLGRKVADGLRKILLQLATGGGKTVMFAGLAKRLLDRFPDGRVLILVHREELLVQARRTIHEWHGIIAEPIRAGVKVCPEAPIYVSMVETASKRLAKNPNFFRNIVAVFVDEAHLANFTKVLDYFPPPVLIFGFTATAKSASKKKPLNGIYEDIVTCVDIPELIEQGALVPNHTYRAKNVNRDELHIKAGEFDQGEMSDMFSKAKHVENTVSGYERFGLGTKTIVFNCSIAHSELVTEAFKAKGYNARHLDGTASKEERDAALEWFKVTPGAVLNNVAVLTTGFDEKSVETVIVNKATKSMPLWLQMCGRGSRLFPGKRKFTIIDMGDNALEHGDWCDPRDWKYIFDYPDAPPREAGVAPVKECPNCESIINASSRVCIYCNTELPAPPVNYDNQLVEFELVTKAINMKVLVDQYDKATKADGSKYSPYTLLHQIKREMIQKAKFDMKLKEIDDRVAYKLLEAYQGRVKEWCNVQGKPYNQWHKSTTALWFQEELKNIFGWTAPELSIAI
jgi:superfamily II DNA or RNA helicase